MPNSGFKIDLCSQNIKVFKHSNHMSIWPYTHAGRECCFSQYTLYTFWEYLEAEKFGHQTAVDCYCCWMLSILLSLDNHAKQKLLSENYESLVIKIELVAIIMTCKLSCHSCYLMFGCIILRHHLSHILTYMLWVGIQLKEWSIWLSLKWIRLLHSPNLQKSVQKWVWRPPKPMTYETF